jgi:tRNA(Leu) C34 or U34 (ribose-2'-O)-methylase TrmL
MGSCLGIRITRWAVEDLKRLPHRILVLGTQGKKTLSQALFENQVAICFGQEATGIRKEVLDMAADTVFIPMKGKNGVPQCGRC